MRVLILPRYSPLGASSRLRKYQYLPALQAAGIDVQVSPLLDDGYLLGMYSGRTPLASVLRGYARRWSVLRDAGDFDVVWVEKEAWPWLPHQVERWLLDGRVRLVLDYDDAVFHRYDIHTNPLVRRLLGRKLDRLMQRADLVTAGNDYLIQRALDAGCKRVEWLPTVVDLDRYPTVAHRVGDGPPVVGWIGSPSTAGYLRQVATVLTPLQAAGRVRCVAIGARPDQLEGTPFESWAWSEASEVAALQQLDIGLMPLPDAAWERGKCGYKLIQYMACGLPVVASPVGVNTTIVCPGENGWLATTPAEWAAAIIASVDNPGLRHRFGAAGRRQVEQVYSLQVQAPYLIGLLREVAGQERN